MATKTVRTKAVPVVLGEPHTTLLVGLMPKLGAKSRSEAIRRLIFEGAEKYGVTAKKGTK